MTITTFLTNVTKDDKRTELQRKVAEIVLDAGDDAEVKSFINDVRSHGCISGIVSELIYYTDTYAWFDKYYNDIDALRVEAEENTGEPLKLGYDLKNTLAWFSFEETLYQLYSEWEG